MRIVMLAGRKESTNIVYNYLKNDFLIDAVIIEQPMPRIGFLKARVKNIGIFRVIGQILFKYIAVPFLKGFSKNYINDIKKTFNLDDSLINNNKILKQVSVNSEETINVLQEINPDVVIVNGTRIISAKVLNCIPALFINMHAGITPLYRGVHGAYWALVENNSQACGVTIHLVDPGIDTGNILAQGLIEPKPKDNFVTYPLLQLKTGLELLNKILKQIQNNNFEIKSPPVGRSRLWSHPTIWEYLYYYVSVGVK